MEGSRNYFSYKERCIYCDIVHQESHDNVRVVKENADFIAIAPFASRSPFELWILPKNHSSCFIETAPTEYASLAAIFRDIENRFPSFCQFGKCLVYNAIRPLRPGIHHMPHESAGHDGNILNP